MPLQPVAVASPPTLPVEVGETPFEVRLEVFEGPLQLLLHLIESRQLDILTVPLAGLADAYVDHLAHHAVDAANLSEFVAIAAQLILLKSRSLLPGEDAPLVATEGAEPDEEELRHRLLEYRALRDAAARLAERDLVAPLLRREPRESDLPPGRQAAVPPERLVEALEGLAATAEPAPPPPEIVAREITIAMQIRALRGAMARGGRVVLQEILAGCRSRTEAAVTLLAALELARRRQVDLRQAALFGPILIEPRPDANPGGAPA